MGNYTYAYANPSDLTHIGSIWELVTPNAKASTNLMDKNSTINVIYYPQYKDKELVKKSAEEKYKEQLKFFREEINKLSLDVEVDIDSSEFRALVFRYAFESPEGIDLVDFVKFIDRYENNDVNQELNDKVKQFENAVSITEINRIKEELISLMPANQTKSTQLPATDSFLETNNTINSLSGYSPSSAVSYAKQWWNKTNNTGYPYYAKEAGQSQTDNTMWDPDGSLGGKTRRGWNDCTNFVSQCLYAGGASQIGHESGPYSSTSWYYEDFFLSKPSYTWGGAQNFYNFWSWRVGVKSYASSVEAGDPISIDFDGDGSIDHTVIVTRLGTTGNYATAYITQHTYDKFEEKSVKNLYDSGYTIYIYDI
jgi:hypothetical protein